MIKLNREMVTFDITGQLEIRPYDLIISRGDTIKCLLTEITTGNIYFYKRKGFQKSDYISRFMVDRYYQHPEDLFFQSFQSKYIILKTGSSEFEIYNSKHL